MSNITKNHKLGILAIVIAAALVGTVITAGDNMAFATKKHGKHNHADQAIGQSQFSRQAAQCVSGDITLISCNNLGFQFQNNEGNLALGQQ